MLSLREDISAHEKTLAIKETDKFEAMINTSFSVNTKGFALSTMTLGKIIVFNNSGESVLGKECEVL